MSVPKTTSLASTRVIVPTRRHRVTHGEAAAILATRDPVLASLIAAAGPIRFRRSKLSPFAALVQATVYQQLAGAAANAIHGRLVVALDEQVEPERLLALSDQALRSVGVSGNKARSLRDLASKALDGTVVLSPRGLSRESDAEVIDQLRTVRGIGPWTAQMFLIFQLRRLDVWPVLDFGVRHGYGLAWKTETPTARQLEPLGDRFRPYRSVVAWYCWRAVELDAGAIESALSGL